MRRHSHVQALCVCVTGIHCGPASVLHAATSVKLTWYHWLTPCTIVVITVGQLATYQENHALHAEQVASARFLAVEQTCP
jgi:hypothetical protein